MKVLLTNPINVIIYYLPFVIGAPLFEELLYRRTIIPLLDKRGLAPFTTVLTSSIVFAIAHFPNDLINGNLYGGIMHCMGVFYISITIGFSYVITRNILFPILIHSAINFISFSGPLVITLGNEVLLLIYNTSIICIGITGISVLVYSVWRYFKRKSTDWVILLKRRSSQNIKSGLISFLIIGITSAFVPIMIEIISMNRLIQSNNISQYLTLLLGTYTVAVVLFFWLGTRAKFELNKKICIQV